MITLYTFGPNFGLPDPSPFVMKTEVHLKMAGLAYQCELGGLPNAPKGKLPFIADGGVVVADSVFIRTYLEKTYGLDFDEGLGREQRALAWTVERMVEDHLYWIMVRSRWIPDENFAKGPASFFDGVPEAMRDAVRDQARKDVAGRLYGHGLGRHGRQQGDEAGKGEQSLSVHGRNSCVGTHAVQPAGHAVTSAGSHRPGCVRDAAAFSCPG